MDSDTAARIARRLRRLGWTSFAFLMAGFLPTLLLKMPPVGMVLSAALAIPLGIRATSVAQAAWRCGAFGVVGGFGIMLAIGRLTAPIAATTQPATMPAVPAVPLTLPLAIMMMGSTAAMCAAVGAVFALSASRRRRMIDRQWQD